MKLNALFGKRKNRETLENQEHQPFDLNEYRLELSLKVCEVINYEVRYGVFRGMRLGPESTWNRMDQGGMILGESWLNHQFVVINRHSLINKLGIMLFRRHDWSKQTFSMDLNQGYILLQK